MTMSKTAYPGRILHEKLIKSLGLTVTQAARAFSASHKRLSGIPFGPTCHYDPEVPMPARLGPHGAARPVWRTPEVRTWSAVRQRR